MFKNLWLMGLAALLAIMPAGVEAARVSPMMVEVEPVGRGSVARVELTNPGQSEYPVEVQMFRGEITEAGELRLTPADENFLVFPAQRIVPANSQQVFRVQYIGEPELATSEMYYMQIRQIPVEFPEAQSQVQLVVNFNVLVNVIPDGTSPVPAIESITAAQRDEMSGLEVRVANEGSRYFTAGTRPWTITGTATNGSPFQLELAPEDMAEMIGVGIVAPGRARVFYIPTPEELAVESVSIKIGN